MRRRRSVTEAVGPLVALVGALTAADRAGWAVTPEDSALAEALFREGKRLVQAGDYAEACPKLAESHRLDPGGGTMLTLALCHEAEGKLAAAWAEFEEALALALNANRSDRARVARAHRDALVPRLSWLTVTVNDRAARTPLLKVTRDGRPLEQPTWGLAVPVERGEHQLEARAPGHLPWQLTVTISKEGEHLFAEIPELRQAASPARAGPTAKAWPAVPIAPLAAPAVTPRFVGPPGQTDLRTMGVLGIGLGASALGVAALAGARAFALQDRARATCPAAACTSPEAVAANTDAGAHADASTALFLVGGAVLATGIALAVWRAPRSEPSRHTTLSLTPFGVAGSW